MIRVASFADMVFILVVVVDLFLLASSRLNAAIRAVALQGALLSGLPLLLLGQEHELRHVLVLSAGAGAIKAVAIPWLMFRAIREESARREVEPFVGYVPSMILGGLGVALSFALSGGLPLPIEARNVFLVPTALSTVWTGLLLVVSRRKAITQVLGFLVLENGVFVIGLLLSGIMPITVEAGVLLDLFAAVFVMGIVIFQMNREFASLDASRPSGHED